jgi:hypothetical protein
LYPSWPGGFVDYSIETLPGAAWQPLHQYEGTQYQRVLSSSSFFALMGLLYEETVTVFKLFPSFHQLVWLYRRMPGTIIECLEIASGCANSLFEMGAHREVDQP